MELGKARYCDTCGVEIESGDTCNECNPENGSKEISFLFICAPVEPEPEKPWWHIW